MSGGKVVDKEEMQGKMWCNGCKEEKGKRGLSIRERVDEMRFRKRDKCTEENDKAIIVEKMRRNML